jgi:hypothetical protein
LRVLKGDTTRQKWLQKKYTQTGSIAQPCSLITKILSCLGRLFCAKLWLFIDFSDIYDFSHQRFASFPRIMVHSLLGTMLLVSGFGVEMPPAIPEHWSSRGVQYLSGAGLPPPYAATGGIPPPPFTEGRMRTFYDWSKRAMVEHYLDRNCVPIWPQAKPTDPGFECSFININETSFLVCVSTLHLRSSARKLAVESLPLLVFKALSSVVSFGPFHRSHLYVYNTLVTRPRQCPHRGHCPCRSGHLALLFPILRLASVFGAFRSAWGVGPHPKTEC